MNVETIDHALIRATVQKPSPMTWLRRHRWFAVVVLLPTLLAAIYYSFIASDVYVSQSRFVIRSPNEKVPQVSTLANLIQTTGMGGGQEQTNEVLDYIRSRNALADLTARIDVRKRFMSRDADFLSRYPPPLHQDKFENLYKFYTSMVSANLDNDTGVGVLEVHAFTPADAHDINAGLLDLSEGLVNRLNERAQGRAIGEAEHRVANAEVRVRNARVALSAYRNQAELIDPAKQATGVLEITNRLISERAALQSQLTLMSRVAPANPAIPALRERIAAVSREIAAQNGRVVGSSTGIASKLAPYENLLVEQEFATQMLNAANTSLEQARAEAQKQKFYLERVVEPNKPDVALLPNRLKRILTMAAASICLYFVGWMLIVGILEHAPED